MTDRMTDGPIIFSAPMVRALLDGSKTQTRRVITPRGRCSLFDGSWTDEYVLDPGNSDWRNQEIRFAVGDHLYVREAWRTEERFDTSRPRDLCPGGVGIGYEAEGLDATWGKLRPSIFLPKWASRLTLVVTGVKVERLQVISEEDAIAEGIQRDHAAGMAAVWGWHDYLRGDDVAKRHFNDPRESFQSLWASINGPDTWDRNPWIGAYTFTVHKCNIDDLANLAIKET